MGRFTTICKSVVSVVREVVVPELAVLCVDVKLVAAAFDKITCHMGHKEILRSLN